MHKYATKGSQNSVCREVEATFEWRLPSFAVMTALLVIFALLLPKPALGAPVIDLSLTSGSQKASGFVHDTAPELVVQNGSFNLVSSVVASPDGTLLATHAKRDGTAVLWDLISGHQLREIKDLGDSPVELVYVDKHCLIGKNAWPENKVRVWNADTQKVEIDIAAGYSGFDQQVAVSPNGRFLAAQIFFRDIEIWDLQTYQKMGTVKIDRDTDAIALSSNGTIALAYKGGAIRLQTTSKTKLDTTRSQVFPKTRQTKSMVFSSDGSSLIVEGQLHPDTPGDKASIMSVFNLNKMADHPIRSMRFEKVYAFGFVENMACVIAEASGCLNVYDLVYANRIRSIKKLDPESGKVMCSLSVEAKSITVATGVAFSIQSIYGTTLQSVQVRPDLFNPIKISFDSGRSGLTVDYSDCTYNWSFEADRPHRQHRQPKFSAHLTEQERKLINSPRFDEEVLSADGKYVLGTVYGVKNRFYLVELSTRVFTMVDSGNSSSSCGLSDDGCIVAYEGENGKLLTFNRRTKKKSIICSEQGSKTFLLSGDGKLLAVALGGENPELSTPLKVYNTQTNEIELTDTWIGWSRQFQFVSNDSKLLYGDVNGISLFDFKRRKNSSLVNFRCNSTSSMTQFFLQGMKLSPDGNWLAVNLSPNRNILIIDVKNGVQSASLTGHTGWVRELAFSPDSNLLATGSLDKTVKLWSLQTGKILATLSRTSNDKWAVVSPDGRFDSKDLDTIPNLAWVLPNERTRSYPCEIFMRQFFEPNLLSRIVKGESFGELPALAKFNRVQPKVEVKMVSSPSDCDDVVNVTVQFKSVSEHQGDQGLMRSGVYDLHLFRNGKLVGNYAGEDCDSGVSADLSNGLEDARTHTFRVQLPHDGTQNFVFTAYAFNSDRIKSQTSRFIYSHKQALRKRLGRAFVIAFGANIYDDPDWELHYAAADARAYCDLLVPLLRASRRYCDVIPIKLVSANDRRPEELDATKSTLKDVITTLCGGVPARGEVASMLSRIGFTKASPEDLVIISFSCHGDTSSETGEFYLFPKDIGKAQNQGLTPKLEAAGISTAELSEWLKEIDVADFAMVIDACHSGAVSGKDFKPAPMGYRGLGQLAYNKKMRILSATQAADTASETARLKHGLLTYALLEVGLRTEKSNQSPLRISLGDWLERAKQTVPLLANPASDSAYQEQDKSVRILAKEGDVRHRAVQLPVLLDFADKKDNMIFSNE
jgi:WD40 repeat protein